MAESFWKHVSRGYVFLLAIAVFFVVSQSQPAKAVYTWSESTLATGATASSSMLIYNSSAAEFAFAHVMGSGASIKFTTSTIANSWATPTTVVSIGNGRFYTVAITTSTNATPYYGMIGDIINQSDIGQAGRNRVLKSAAGNGSSWTTQATTTAVTDNFQESEITIQNGSIFIAGNSYIGNDHTFMIAKSNAVDNFTAFTTSTLYQGSDQIQLPSIHSVPGMLGVSYRRNSSFTDIYTATSTDGAVWGTSTYTPGGTILSQRMRLDSTGKPWIAVLITSGMDCSSGCTLKLGRYEGASGWVTETIDSVGSLYNKGDSIGHSMDIAFVNGITPVIAYYKTAAGTVRYAYRDSGNSGCSGADAASYTCGDALSGVSATYTGVVSLATNGSTQVMITASDLDANSIKAATADLEVVASESSSQTALQAPPPPPKILTMELNSNATTTISRDIEVALTTDGANEMVLSLDPSFSGLTWVPFSTKSIITLPETPGTYKVYAKVGSSSGSSQVSERVITYQPETASGEITFSAGFTSSTIALASFTYTSNVTEMQFAATSSFTSVSWMPVMATSSIILDAGDGIKTIFARFKTAAGTISPIYSASITVDTTAPNVATIATPADGAQITVDKPVFAGFAESLARVELVVLSSMQQMKFSASSTADAAGAWSIATTTTIPNGAYTVQIEIIDSAGNKSLTATSSFIILDKTAPAVPVIIAPGASEIVAATTTQVIGHGEPQSKIVLVRNGSATFTTLVDDKGDWAITIVGLKNGSYTLNAHAIDKAGNASGLAERIFSVALPVIQLSEPEPKAKPPVPVIPKKPATSLPPSESTSVPVAPSAPAGTGGMPTDLGIGSTSSQSPVESDNEISPIVSSEPEPVSEPVVEKTATEQVSAAFSDVVVVTRETAKAAVKSAVRTVKVIKTVADQPEVQVANQAVVVPTAAVAAAASVGGAVNGAQAVTYLRFLFTQPLFLLTRKRRKGWGTVYNALTKMPSDLATVRLVDAQSGRVVQSRVTDQMGRYQFFAKPGEYRIEVSKPEFQFPPEYLKGKNEDGKYADLYTGDVLRPAAASAISYNTPLDPIGADQPTDELVKVARKKYVAAVLGSAGLAVTAVSFVISPTPLVGGFFVLHVISHFMFRRIATPHKPETWGVISDAAGTPVAQAVVRVFDKQYNKLLDTQVTDEKGRYAFLVGHNDYYLMVEKPGFDKLVSDIISVPETEGGSVLAKNLQIIPAGQVDKTPSV